MNYWDKKFKESTYIYGKEPNTFIADFHKDLDVSGNALAIAEGEGRNAVYLARQGMKVTSWDFASSGLKKTKQLAEEYDVDVTTKLIDLNDAKWEENKWDEIICVYGHFPPELKDKTLEGIKSAVKPGGYYVTEVYSPYQIPYKSGGPQNSELLYSIDDFMDYFSEWRIIHLFMGEVVRQEGIGHNGLAHVIQFAAQKPINK